MRVQRSTSLASYLERRCACRKWLRKDMAKIEEMLRAAQDEEVKGKVKSKAVRAQKRQVGAPIASYT